MTREEFCQPLRIGERSFLPGERDTVCLPVGRGVTHEVYQLTVHVRRGKKPGPRLLVTAAMHGDEINGVEVVRRLVENQMRRLVGDLLLIPVVNLPAFASRSRYLPDRRDLNRLFPGSDAGSLGARIARVLTFGIARHCTHGIDLHTGAVNRPNLPQIRFSANVPGAREMAEAFGAPVMIAADARPGSFREEFSKWGPQLMFEGGEAEILEPASVRLATTGVLAVMESLGMLPVSKRKKKRPNPVECLDSFWERAPRGGVFLPSVHLGQVVKAGPNLGQIGDPFGAETTAVVAGDSGIVIGRTRNAVIDEGDGIFHIGLTHRPKNITRNLEAAVSELDHSLDYPVFDEVLED